MPSMKVPGEPEKDLKEKWPFKQKEKLNLQERLAAAKAETTAAILQIERMYELPAYLTELIVSSCLSDIRECSNKELLSRR